MLPARSSLLGFLAVIISCASPTAPVVEGVWGGTEASLSLTPAGGAAGYPCGAGTIDSAWTVSHHGEFRATGGHFFGGGPIPPGGGTAHPAVYSGQVNGNTMILTVKLTDLNQVLGPFRLVRGGAVVSNMCV